MICENVFSVLSQWPLSQQPSAGVTALVHGEPRQGCVSLHFKVSDVLYILYNLKLYVFKNITPLSNKVKNIS